MTVDERKTHPPAAAAVPADLSGDVIWPDDPAYAAARLAQCAQRNGHPALIVRCHNTAGVVAAVRYARAHSLPLTARSGGHSVLGASSRDGALVVDLTPMHAVRLDPATGLTEIEPGATWSAVAGALAAQGRAISSGDTGSVGVGGLALGGGIGFLVRKFGLTIDHVRAVELVTAGGAVRQVDAESDPDLFWALRGGGGNFGIATRFTMQAPPLAGIVGGALVFRPTPEALVAYTRLAAAAPDELSTIALIMQAPPMPFLPPEIHGTRILAVLCCYAGAPEAGMAALAPLAGIGEPLGRMLAPMPYPALFQFTAEGTARQSQTTRTMFLNALTPAMAEMLLAQAERAVNPAAMVQLRVLGGAMARVPADATAFAHRAAPLLLTWITGWPADAPPEEDARHEAWAESCRAGLAGLAIGAYANFMGDDGPEALARAYPPVTLARLAAIKRRVDPDNVFHGEHAIAPGPAA